MRQIAIEDPKGKHIIFQIAIIVLEYSGMGYVLVHSLYHNTVIKLHILY